MTGEVVKTFLAIVEITAKSIRALLHTISSFKLSFEEFAATVAANIEISEKPIMAMGIPFFEIATG